uniref:Cytochrome c oxidase subunit 3 n=1 Tax=Foenatopus ruficollis TaxID=1738635 RepID=A0A342I4E4_9HYME|nr:cytochrome c oxidase subunit III [Foenatopus ruficollis]
MNKLFHPYHLVTNSPWPIYMSISLMTMMIGSINYFYNKNNLIMIIGLLNLIICKIHWWRDTIRESTFQGFHTKLVYKGLRFGMMLFIISEIFFLFSFFWAYFHMSLSPSTEIGMMWPPKGIKTFNPYHLPLLNTIILISSGITITWAHHCLLNNILLNMKKATFFTIFLGLYFSMFQYMEFYNSPFSISDSTYGSTFFMATGFHGIHVIIGTLFIMWTFWRMINNQFSSQHHFGFEAASWYWHFVDVVWLFLYISIYWWSSN